MKTTESAIRIGEEACPQENAGQTAPHHASRSRKPLSTTRQLESRPGSTGAVEPLTFRVEFVREKDEDTATRMDEVTALVKSILERIAREETAEAAKTETALEETSHAA